MKYAVRFFFLLLVAIQINGCNSDSTNEPATNANNASITGTLSDARNGQLISGATLMLVGANKSANTGADGKYSFTNITPGTYSIIAKKTNFGYGSSESFTLVTAERATANSTLMPVMGTYSMGFTWAGEGRRNGMITIHDNLTVTYTEPGNGSVMGSWTLTNDDLTLIQGINTFTGKISGDNIIGTMRDTQGNVGTWSAVR